MITSQSTEVRGVVLPYLQKGSNADVPAQPLLLLPMRAAIQITRFTSYPGIASIGVLASPLVLTYQIAIGIDE